MQITVEVDKKKFERFISLGNLPWTIISDEERKEWDSLSTQLSCSIWEQYCRRALPDDRSEQTDQG
jgi:hypothetical protein